MIKPNLLSEAYKRQNIVDFLLPALGVKTSDNENMIADVVCLTKLHSALRNQGIESPGTWETGRLWLSIAAMSHSYCYYNGMRYPHGTAIFSKRVLIFNGSSLHNGSDRLDHIQMIEPGDLLSISYPNVSYLMQTYQEINATIRIQAEIQEIDFRERNIIFRNLPSVERVKQLRAAHETFIKCSTQEIQAMHAYLSLKQYGNIIRGLEEK